MGAASLEEKEEVSLYVVFQERVSSPAASLPHVLDFVQPFP